MIYRRYINNLKGFYTREISSNAENKFRFLFMYFILILGVVVYFGFSHGISAIKNKITTINEINVISQNLKQNVTSVNALLPYLGVNAQTEFLSKAIPVEIYPNLFLREFVLHASKNGFDLVNLNISQSKENNVVTQSVFAKLQGDINKLPTFLQQVENMGRFTSIKSIKVISNKSDLESSIYLVNISLEIYSIDLNE